MTATQQPDPFGNEPAPSFGASGPRAGFWLRFGAAFLDGVILVVPFLVLALVISPALYFLLFPAQIAYFTYYEGGPTGQTIGKRVCGIRVIDFAGGGSIGYGRAFVRWIGRLISGLFLYLGYFWMLWDKEKQTWHDKMANDVVVPVSAYPV
jgi:uncharacterized RDD family membrane protein YckC